MPVRCLSSTVPDSPSNLFRYSRQMLLPGFGELGQRRLLASHAVIVGVGALGCGVADLFARAGVGTITLIDRDIVEETNLQRQSLFTEADARAGVPKADAAAARLRLVNSSISICPIAADVTSRTIGRLLAGASVVIDGTDNFATRYLLNDHAVKEGIPWVYAGAIGTGVATMTIIPGETACLRCVFEDVPFPGTGGTCETVGVLGPAIALVSAIQAAEGLKLLIGQANSICRGVRAFDLWHNTSRTIEAQRAPDCVCCVQRRFEFLQEMHSETAALCGRDAVQVTPRADGARVDLGVLAARLSSIGEVQSGASFVRLTLPEGGLQITVFGDGRAIVKGTTHPERARAMYAKYVGS